MLLYRLCSPIYCFLLKGSTLWFHAQYRRINSCRAVVLTGLHLDLPRRPHYYPPLFASSKPSCSLGYGFIFNLLSPHIATWQENVSARAQCSTVGVFDLGGQWKKWGPTRVQCPHSYLVNRHVRTPCGISLTTLKGKITWSHPNRNKGSLQLPLLPKYTTLCCM